MPNQNNTCQQDARVVVELLEEERILYLNGEITSDVSFFFNKALLRLEHQNSSADITLYINSPGGSVPDGLAMIDTMNLVSCDIATVCVGFAASMGAMILMSGQKGKRRILPHSEVLIHQPLGHGGNTYRQASDIEINTRNILRTRDTLYRLISQATGQPFERVQKDCDRDYILTAQEALEYGIVDEILSSHRI